MHRKAVGAKGAEPPSIKRSSAIKVRLGLPGHFTCMPPYLEGAAATRDALREDAINCIFGRATRRERPRGERGVSIIASGPDPQPHTGSDGKGNADVDTVRAGAWVGATGRREDSTAGKGEAGDGNNVELGDAARASITHTRVSVKGREEQLSVVVHDLAPNLLPCFLLSVLLDPCLELGTRVEDG